MVRISLENLGPFKSRQTIELKPLTLIIGKNSVGKSFLAYLIWLLATTPPDFDVLIRTFEEKGGRQYVEELMRAIEERKPIRAKEALEDAILILLKDALPEALAHNLMLNFPRIYGKSLSSIIAKNAHAGLIEVESDNGAVLRIKIDQSEKVSVSILDYENIFAVVMSLIDVDKERGLLFFNSRGLTKEEFSSIADAYGELMRILGTMIASSFTPSMFAPKEFAALLVDSRAGVLRVLLRPYTAMLSETYFPDQAFIAYYYMLAERLALNSTTMPAEAEKLLEELGVRLEPRIEGGVHSIYVRTWTGETLPMPIAPSGARESATIVASLVNKGEPRLIIVEEPEAHLHPRAQVLLADLVAWAVRENEKWVIATTHSDYFVYEINNLIMAASRGRKGLDYRSVGAYLVRRGDGEAVIELVPVDSEGIAEDEFARIAEELATARGFLALAENQIRRGDFLGAS